MVSEKEKQRRKLWWETHKEQARQYAKNYREKHHDKKLEGSRIWKQNHKEEVSEYMKEYRKKNIDSLLESQKEYHFKHKEERNKQSRDYYYSHKKERLEKAKLWKQNNPEKIHELKLRHKDEEKEAIRKKAQQKIKLEGLCERCNIKPAEHRHHPDYSKPLDVQLLCHECHAEIHKKYTE